MNEIHIESGYKKLRKGRAVTAQATHNKGKRGKDRKEKEWEGERKRNGEGRKGKELKKIGSRRMSSRNGKFKDTIEALVLKGCGKEREKNDGDAQDGYKVEREVALEKSVKTRDYNDEIIQKHSKIMSSKKETVTRQNKGKRKKQMEN